jgi:hypothetical protein
MMQQAVRRGYRVRMDDAKPRRAATRLCPALNDLAQAKTMFEWATRSGKKVIVAGIDSN